MELRGKRECADCGTRWSYYETGEIVCPDCGSVKSVGIGERVEHTDSPTALDLQPAIDQIDVETPATVAATAADQARQYLYRAGFIDAGRLRPLDDRYLLAAELRRVGGTLSHSMRITDTEELYLLSLLRGGEDGQRPPPSEVPETLRAERGLAVAAGVDAYVSDIRRAVDDPDPASGTETASAAVETLRRRRVRGEIQIRAGVTIGGEQRVAEPRAALHVQRHLAVVVADPDRYTVVVSLVIAGVNGHGPSTAAPN